MYPEKPKRSPLPLGIQNLDFVAPLPIEECVTKLKRQAYCWDCGKRYQVNIDAISPAEWIVQIFTPAHRRALRRKLVEGRLIAIDEHRTRVTITRMQARAGRERWINLMVAAGFIGYGMLITAPPPVPGLTTALGILPMGFGAVLLLEWLFPTSKNFGETYAVMRAIQLMLNR